MAITIYNGIRLLDQKALWEQIGQGSSHPSDRITGMLRECGVRFFDKENLYAKEPEVLIRSIGGMPIRICEETDLPLVGNMPLSVSLQYLRETMGYAAMDSYLNPKDKSALQLYETNCELHGLPSVAHTVHLGFFVVGLSAKAELELNCQRDIVHLSRLTSARTVAQDNPPILVESEDMLPLYATLRATINSSCPASKEMTAAQREVRNSAWSLSKCGIIGITGSLKNLIKVSQISSDPGKEDEVRNICLKIGKAINTLFPEISHD